MAIAGYVYGGVAAAEAAVTAAVAPPQPAVPPGGAAADTAVAGAHGAPGSRERPGRLCLSLRQERTQPWVADEKSGEHRAEGTQPQGGRGAGVPEVLHGAPGVSESVLGRHGLVMVG